VKSEDETMHKYMLENHFDCFVRQKKVSSSKFEARLKEFRLHVFYLPIANHKQFNSVNCVSARSGWSGELHSYGVNLIFFRVKMSEISTGKKGIFFKFLITNVNTCDYAKNRTKK
jgi:hypothetical protein